MFPLNVIAGSGLTVWELIAGTQGDFRGFISGQSGSLIPNQIRNNFCTVLFSDVGFDNFVVAFNGIVADSDDIWAQMVISGVFVSGQQTITVVRSTRDTFNPSANSSWTWDPNPFGVFVNGNVYRVVVS